MVSSMQRHQYPFHLSPPLADSWITKLVTERGNSDVLAKAFVNIISKSSNNLAPSYEALTRMAEFFANDLQFSVFGKIVKYTVDRMRIDEMPTGRVEEFKDSMTVCRFQGYVSKLGATQVITNGMFHTFGFSNGKKHQWRVTDLPLFVNKLASENPKMDYLTALKLLEQMHGYHVKEYPQRYSPLLHPDVQMARIYKGLLSRDPTNKEIGAEYKKVSESLKGNPASKFGKPTKMSNKFRNRASVTEGEVFKVLPLNVILKVISLTSNDLSMSLKLVRTMIKKHECRINNETMLYVLKIFEKNPEALGQFGAFFEGFRNDIVMNRQLYGIVIDLLIKGGDFERLDEVLRGYEKAGWFVSGEMCERVNGASEGAGVNSLRGELVSDTGE
ncbi:DEKNAAC101474 [Brettanomyces naardenensis]|uniref:DEKNAAC101474 n=1 Tax=Brettanomyces naardenensis TaxID=13370 RepID=A0A448YI70_BRENA|nr:DEKNAAC101474 [Brettanomyces naardenensis]